ATRIVLASIGTTDTRWNDSQVESYRNFANKIWNAARFCLLNSEGAQVGRGFEGDPQSWALHDRWIMSRLQKTTRDVSRSIEAYDFHAAVQTLYHFFWDDFCDWYIELSKADVTGTEASPARDAARSRVLTVLEQALRLLHPFMPYITEELWLRLPGVGVEQMHPAYNHAEPTIMLAAYPQTREGLIDETAEVEMSIVIELISSVRSIRSEMNIKPSQEIDLIVETDDGKLLAFEVKKQVQRLTRASNVLEHERDKWPRAAARGVIAGGRGFAVPLEGLIDFAQERERLRKEQEKLTAEAAKLEAQLSNPSFVGRAPAEKVEELRQRVSDIAQRTGALTQTLEALA
ncbi:MAG: class I tRNA ligase family protein, partial [Rubrivivax sp.]|nr:class I tRNA ligase family protein [Pyrinomonadaceae bacterium]